MCGAHAEGRRRQMTVRSSCLGKHVFVSQIFNSWRSAVIRWWSHALTQCSMRALLDEVLIVRSSDPKRSYGLQQRTQYISARCISRTCPLMIIIIIYRFRLFLFSIATTQHTPAFASPSKADVQRAHRLCYSRDANWVISKLVGRCATWHLCVSSRPCDVAECAKPASA